MTAESDSKLVHLLPQALRILPIWDEIREAVQSQHLIQQFHLPMYDFGHTYTETLIRTISKAEEEKLITASVSFDVE